MAIIKEQRAKAQVLQPSMQIGKSGITEGLIKELKSQLKTKKLIKVKFMKSFIEGKDKKQVAINLAKKTDSVIVLQVGHTVTLAKKKKINKKPKV
ncbi:YhbY family RNA-binding protein [Candidatus Woesearchaeota archaeon]|nr:YhbY family RNA-binding protein [Candidatus Woesearchaeota archaeon]MBW3005977.1 YhbY family RNA-binding protein [Candidatus Woesearchaeota archaeon]